MLKFMLDTNICIFTIKNKPAHIRERFNLNTGRMCISSVTVMELVYGAEKVSFRSVISRLSKDLFRVLTCWIMTALLPHIPVRSVLSSPVRDVRWDHLTR